MKTRTRFSGRLNAAAFFVVTALTIACAASPAIAQDGHEADAAAALSSVLSAACRANQTQFATYLTADSAAAFRALTDDQRAQFVKRFSLSDSPGRPLISADAQNHTVLRCEAPEATIEFRFGSPRVRENLTFVPVTVVDGQETEFGLVREGRGWRLLSLGLVLIDVPQLTKQWADQDLEAQESGAIDGLRSLADAIETYRRAYGKIPDSIAELGPAAKGDVSPDKASLLNEHIAAGTQGGYHFRYRIISNAADQNATSFELAATPSDYGKTGRRSFFYDAAGKLHAADKHGSIGSADDPLLGDEKSQ
jgi:hypothetical protein